MARFGTHIMRFPTGRWGIVGDVPASLAFVALDGTPATREQIECARQFGPRLAGVKERSWESREAVLSALACLGVMASVEKE